jgi:phage terminase large subunit-like protein
VTTAAVLVTGLARTPEPRAALRRLVAALTPKELAALWYEWRFWARPDQLAPGGDWDTWMLCTGIGFGNTRSGAEWIRDEVGKAASTGFVLRIALVGATAADVRDTMIEGESGILAVSPPESWGIKVDYESSKRRVTWYRAGVIVATATCFSAEEPDRLRGPNISHAWCDELAAWENLTATWLNLQGRMRLGPHPKVCVTTTPRPLELLRDLAVDPRTVVVRGSSMANAANLPDRYKRQLAKHAGTEYGRQEVEGEILDDRTGAMFSGKWFRRLATEPELRRVVVAIDPAISTEHYSDETGIMVVGADFEDRGYVLDDKSAKATPEGWAERAIQAFDDHGADAFVVERNRGGDLVRSMLRAVLRQMGKRESDYRVHEVSATRGKAVRADPIAAIYEHGNVFHVGPAERFAALEKELITWDPSTVARKKAKSPNRLDALVWGVSFLSLTIRDDLGVESLDGPGHRLDPLAENQRGERMATPAAAVTVGDGWVETDGRYL